MPAPYPTGATATHRSGPEVPDTAAARPYARRMPPASTPSRARLAAGLLAGALALLPLAACQFTSDSVNCSGSSCSVTLKGNGAKANVLGSQLAFAGVQNGQATLQVGGSSVTCTQGQSVSAGPLTLTCSTVTDDSVELTASLG